MTKRTLRIAASVLIPVTLVFIVARWGLGLMAIAIAMIMSVATRWAGSGPE